MEVGVWVNEGWLEGKPAQRSHHTHLTEAELWAMARRFHDMKPQLDRWVVMEAAVSLPSGPVEPSTGCDPH
uniref:Uncharacterized protein n=1 Tax=Knipowitschia caucasica TaxID=637954 RepID=A0AAV2L7H5_KNICA